MQQHTMIAVWRPSMKDVTRFTNTQKLGDYFVQALPDNEMRSAYWVLYKLPEDVYERVTAISGIVWTE